MMLSTITLSDLGELVVGVCIVLGVVISYFAMSRKTMVKLDDKPAVEFRKAPKRYNHDATEQRFGRAENRLDGHDTELDRLWQTLRVDLPDMERRINKAGEDRIETVRSKMDEVMEKLGELKGRVH
jgi:hypothetical protein